MPDAWTALSLILGAVGATGVIISWVRRPKVEVSGISTHFSDPPVTGGTILNTAQGNAQFGIPAIFGSVIVENGDRFLSESLRSCQVIITVERGQSTILRAIGAWDEQGKGSLEKEVDIKKGDKKQLQLFRAIIEPDEKESYNGFQEKEASFFPALQIEEMELPLYESDEGKIWIQMPEMVEAAFGGWLAEERKPDQPGEYTLILDINAENLDKKIIREIDFKAWLIENSDYWQQGWRERCGPTIQKAKNVVDSI